MFIPNNMCWETFRMVLRFIEQKHISLSVVELFKGDIMVNQSIVAQVSGVYGNPKNSM